MQDSDGSNRNQARSFAHAPEPLAARVNLRSSSYSFGRDGVEPMTRFALIAPLESARTMFDATNYRLRKTPRVAHRQRSNRAVAALDRPRLTRRIRALPDCGDSTTLAPFWGPVDGTRQYESASATF